MTRLLTYTLISFVTVLALSIALERAFSPSFNRCISREEAGEQAAQDKQSPSLFGGSVGTYARCTGEFVETNKEAVTALATFVIAAFTFTLWLTGSSQLLHGRSVDRAYLTVGGDIVDDGAGGKVFRLDVENIGRTAAFVTGYHIHFADWDEVKATRRISPMATLDDRFGPIGSDRSSFKKIKTSVPMRGSPDVVYGAVWYRDIWRKSRYSRFILSIDVPAGRTLPDVEITRAHSSYRRWI